MKLSKSKMLLYLSCPKKFKLLYVDKLKEPKTGYEWHAKKGQDIHKQIENFYKNDVKVIDGKIIINEEKYKRNKMMRNFINLKKKVLEKGGIKYFFPTSQEVDYYDKKSLNIHGYVDATYNHYIDGEPLLIDWKSGKVKDSASIRRETVFYKLCVDGNLDKPIKYIAEYFLAHDYLFLEEVTAEMIEKVKKEIEMVHDLINAKHFNCQKGDHCRYCGFKNTKYCEAKEL